MRKEQVDGDRIFLIHGFLTDEECEAYIEESESTGFDDAPITTATGMIMRKDIRNNTRVMVDDEPLAEALFEWAEPFLPNPLGNWELFGLNERLRYYRYDPGQSFRPHFDGSFKRSEDERSLLTFMVYLNEGFTGGATRFYTDSGAFKLEIVPRRGLALVFEHPQLHEGAPVESGRKYVLRTDVMYQFSG
jgi:prolyl 4-hydroxylase